MKFRLLLSLGFLSLLSGCWMKPTEIYIYVRPPESLTTFPCYASAPGHTLNDLAVSYVYNAGCIRKYEVMIESLQEYLESLPSP